MTYGFGFPVCVRAVLFLKKLFFSEVYTKYMPAQATQSWGYADPC